MPSTDITHLIERRELLERSFGVRLSGLFATQQGPQNDVYWVSLNGEVQMQNGEELTRDLRLAVTIYDADERVLFHSEHAIAARSFFESHAFSLRLHVPLCAPAKITLYPKVV